MVRINITENLKSICFKFSFNLNSDFTGFGARKSKVCISHLSNPAKIYLQTKEYHNSFQPNCGRYESLALSNPIPSNVLANNIYLVCDNDKWYRGKMILKDYESYNFLLIDNGHTKLI